MMNRPIDIVAKQTKRTVRQAFSRAAPCYDAVADYQRDVGERLMARCLDLSVPSSVLDAGCGTGHGLHLIRRQWPLAQVVALDFAEPMLCLLPPTSSTSRVCGDLETLPLATTSADLVWSSLALQWCDAHRVMREFSRVLNPGGYLAATTLGPGTFAELRQAFRGVDAFGHTNEFLAAATLQEALAAAGFTALVCESIVLVRHFSDLRSLLASVRELGASRVVTPNRRLGLMGKRAWRRFADNYETKRTMQGLPLSYETFIIVAQKSTTAESEFA